MKPFLHKELTNRIIGIYYEIYTDLGYGFLEKVYQNAMFYELQRQGYEAEAQKPIKVFHKGVIVGEYFADILVENQVLLELKAADKLVLEHEYQLINYLKATKIEVGLLFNFGANPEFKRKIMTNDKKPLLKSKAE